MVGDSQIGKTSLMVRYVEGSFNEDYIQTLGEYRALFLCLPWIGAGRTWSRISGSLALYSTKPEEWHRFATVARSGKVRIVIQLLSLCCIRR